MPHFRVDDALHSHPKAQRAGDEALGMWARAGSYCMAYLTDGFVPEWWVKQQPKGTAKAKKLVAVGLWNDGAERDGEKGYQFHEFLAAGRQDSREKVEADRELARKRKEKSRRESRVESRRDTPRDERVESRVESRRSPSRDARVTQPNPTHEEISGHLPESATDSNGRGSVAATPGADLVRRIIPNEIPDATRTALRHQASALINNGTPPDVAEQALRDWLAKTGVGPGILPSLAADVIKRRNHSSPAMNGVTPGEAKVAGWANLGTQFPTQEAIER